MPEAVRAGGIVSGRRIGHAGPRGGSADSHVVGGSRGISQAINGYKVIKQQPRPSDPAKVGKIFVRRETTHPYDVVRQSARSSNSAAVNDFMNPDRVVIGAKDATPPLMIKLRSRYTAPARRSS